jgi:glucose/arabinose dehydrogenase
MRMLSPASFFLAATAVALAGCGEEATLPVAAGTGPNPELPAPNKTLIPTVNVAPAKGWPEGGMPKAEAGLQVAAFADGLDHPRWLHILPNGDVLVAESNSPPKEQKSGGIKSWIQGKLMSRAGAKAPSANRITLLRDTNGDGVADVQRPYVTGLWSPFGMQLVGRVLYVANADALLAFPYDPAADAIVASPRTVARLPAERNHHWTKSLAAGPDGKLYVGVGSNSNVAENGLHEEEGRAAVWQIDPASGAARIYATGLRNPVGIEFNGSQLYVVVNERDELGSDLVPDYLTSVRDGAFYGWPWSYYGDTVDTRVEPARPDMVVRAIAPDYALGSHVAPLGLAFSDGARLGPLFASGAFIGEHGSWNRDPFSGYKVVFVPFANGRPVGQPIDVLTGFLAGDKAFGRPVGVEIARDGALLVADDVGNTVWRVSAAR